MPIYIQDFEKDLEKLLEKYKITKMYLFGSVLTPFFKEGKSDIDMLVEFDEKGLLPEQVGELYLDFSWNVEKFLNRKVDIVRNRTFKNPFFEKSLNHHKILFYDRERNEVFA